MPAIKRGHLTMSDIVLLRLLADHPMHGHQASIELDRQQLAAWTGISRPQVYWSLNKLAKLGLITPIENEDATPPRQRRVFAITEKSRVALKRAFAQKYWSTQHLRPLFLAWILLAQDVDPALFHEQVARRRRFLERELARHRATLESLRQHAAHRRSAHGRNGTKPPAAWVVRLQIQQLQLELRWLAKIPGQLE